MKKLVLSCSILCTLFVTSVTVKADATDWILKIRASTKAGTSFAGMCSIGWFSNYTNGLDDYWNEYIEPPLPGIGAKNSAAAAVYHSPSIQSLQDIRTPLVLDPTLPKVWTIAIYTQGTWNSSEDIRITFLPQTGSRGIFPASSFAPDVRIILDGVYQAQFTPSEFAGLGEWYFDTPSVDQNGNLLTAENPAFLTLAIVPEPASILTLLCGLGGTATMVRRRSSLV